MAPGATIILVEAASDSIADLETAWEYAGRLVAHLGGGEVSMSFGSGEFSGETSYDSTFTGYSNVVFFASAGDGPGTQYPCVSPNVVCVGGTTIVRNSSGSFLQEVVWNSDDTYQGTGGGPSAYEPRPPYQNYVESVVQTARGAPDVAAAADPNTGAWIYQTTNCGGWCFVGGTSWASPTWAGISNASGNFLADNAVELLNLYYYATQLDRKRAKDELERANNAQDANSYRPAVEISTDITSGACGLPPSLNFAGVEFPALVGWDFCSGLGTPLRFGPGK
jgi:kumamolisin